MQERAFRKILATYKKAWEERNPILASELFSKKATYREDPFDEEPAQGHSEIQRYWEEAVAKQRNITFTYGNLYASGDCKVWAAEWTARYTKTETGERNVLKGVLFCRLTKDGRRVKNFWEYWHLKAGTPSFTWHEIPKKSP